MKSFISKVKRPTALLLVVGGVSFTAGSMWSRYPDSIDKTTSSSSAERPPSTEQIENPITARSANVSENSADYFPAHVWSSLTDSATLKEAAGLLEKMGFPHNTRGAILYQLAVQKREQERLEIEFPEGMNWWETPPVATPEGKNLLHNIMLSADFEAREAVGPNLEPTERERRRLLREYGNLSPEKISKLKVLEKKLLGAQLTLSNSTGDEAKASYASAVEEINRSITAILSSDELQDYQLRRSKTTQQTVQYLAGVSLSEQEFTQIAELQAEAYVAISDMNSADRSNYLYRGIAFAEADLESLKLMGPNRFLTYQTNKSPLFSSLVEVVQSAGFEASKAVDIWTIEARTLRTLSEPNKSLNQQELNTALERARLDLQAELGTEAYQMFYNSGASLWLKKLERTEIEEGG